MYLFVNLFCGLVGFCALQCTPNVPSPPTAAPVVSAPSSPTSTESPLVDVAYLMGKFVPSAHPDFVQIPKTHTTKPDAWLRREAWEAFAKMRVAAQRDGVTLTIVSATRTFAQQKTIWEGKWQRFAAEVPEASARARKIMLYSSMPGASRHHWGTDIDLNDLNNSTFEGEGKHRKVYEWLSAHAAEYGFGQPYSPKGESRPFGYEEEKWHWSYLPLSKAFLTAYNQLLTDRSLAGGGFVGAETATAIGVVKHYVNGIHPSCKP